MEVTVLGVLAQVGFVKAKTLRNRFFTLETGVSLWKPVFHFLGTGFNSCTAPPGEPVALHRRLLLHGVHVQHQLLEEVVRVVVLRDVLRGEPLDVAAQVAFERHILKPGLVFKGEGLKPVAFKLWVNSA
jgi:hypothetical protein